jgi:hypothetical protein
MFPKKGREKCILPKVNVASNKWSLIFKVETFVTNFFQGRSAFVGSVLKPGAPISYEAVQQ